MNNQAACFSADGGIQVLILNPEPIFSIDMQDPARLTEEEWQAVRRINDQLSQAFMLRQIQEKESRDTPAPSRQVIQRRPRKNHQNKGSQSI